MGAILDFLLMLFGCLVLITLIICTICFIICFVIYVIVYMIKLFKYDFNEEINSEEFISNDNVDKHMDEYF